MSGNRSDVGLLSIGLVYRFGAKNAWRGPAPNDTRTRSDSGISCGSTGSGNAAGAAL